MRCNYTSEFSKKAGEGYRWLLYKMSAHQLRPQRVIDVVQAASVPTMKRKLYRSSERHFEKVVYIGLRFVVDSTLVSQEKLRTTTQTGLPDPSW